ncbi:MAG: DUF4430 domain-containing protein [Collinsella sp.]|nr:DUF4430 domain-containing protein [Collinsella sp.]
MADEKRADARVHPGAEAGAEAAPARTGQRRAVAVLALASAALIVAAVALALALPGGAPSLGGLWETTAPGSAPVMSGSADAAGQGSGSVAEASAPGPAASGDASAAAPAAAGDEGAPASAPADDGGAASGGSGPAPASPGASASGGGTAAPGAGASASGGATGPSAPTAPDTVTVTISVSARAAGGGTLASTSLTFERGATAYDALMGTDLSVSSENTVYGIYVRAIGGYAASGSSGWMYAVNGSEPNTSAANYVLEDGDAVSWYYSA